eukprot:3305106-Pleurochrysis_carterae.AAC.1
MLKRRRSDVSSPRPLPAIILIGPSVASPFAENLEETTLCEASMVGRMCGRAVEEAAKLVAAEAVRLALAEAAAETEAKVTAEAEASAEAKAHATGSTTSATVVASASVKTMTSFAWARAPLSAALPYASVSCSLSWREKSTVLSVLLHASCALAMARAAASARTMAAAAAADTRRVTRLRAEMRISDGEECSRTRLIRSRPSSYCADKI